MLYIDKTRVSSGYEISVMFQDPRATARGESTPHVQGSNHTQPGSEKVRRVAYRPWLQQLIHTLHSGSSKNSSAILSFKNTDSHRLRHNCQRSSGEEVQGKEGGGGGEGGLLKSIFACNQATGVKASVCINNCW